MYLTPFAFLFRRFIRRTRAEETREAETIACRRQRRECSEKQFMDSRKTGEDKSVALPGRPGTCFTVKTRYWINKPRINKTKSATTEKIWRFYTLHHSITGEKMCWTKMKLAAIKSQTITVHLPLCVNSCARWMPIASYSGPKYSPSSLQSAEVRIPLNCHSRTSAGKEVMVD